MAVAPQVVVMDDIEHFGEFAAWAAGEDRYGWWWSAACNAERRWGRADNKASAEADAQDALRDLRVQRSITGDMEI